ncbi:MAG TPA: YfhO family protein [Vicinamibacteria bacterium]
MRPPAVLFLALLTLALHFPVLLGRVPLPMDLILQFPPWQEGWTVAPQRETGLGDLVTEVYPWHAYGGDLVRRGELPLWNPYVFLGAPYQAHPCSALFDPVNWLYYLLPAPAAWSAAFVLRAFLAGLFMGLFLRALGASPTGALAGALGFGFAGFMLVWRGFPQGDSALWLPLLCLAVHRLRARPGPRTLALTAVAFALPLLGGHTGIAIYVVATGLAYAAFVWWWPPEGAPPERGRFLRLATVAGALSLAVAAVQLLPSLEWVQQTLRSPVRSDRGLLASPAWEVASLFYREAATDPNAVGMRVPSAVTYSGILTVIAALAAPLHRDRRQVGFLALVLFLAVQVVYGWGPMYWISSRAPFLAAQHNRRVALVVCFCVTALAALGLTALERVAAGEKRGTWVPAALGAVLGLVALAALRAHTAPGAPPLPWRHGLASSLLLLLASAALLTPPALKALGTRGLALAAPALLALDVASFGAGHVPFVPRSAVYPSAPVIDHLRQAGVPLFRFVPVDVSAPSNAVEIAYRLPSPTGYDFPMQRTYEVLAPLSMGILGGTLDSATVAARQDRLLDLASVKYVLATTWNRGPETLAARPDRFRRVYERGRVQLFENLGVLPRALVVPAAGVEAIGDPRAALARLTSPEFDPTRSVICEQRPFWIGDAAASREPGAVDELEILTNEIRLAVTAPGPAIVALSDAFYPGWKAWVDGRPAPVLRVNHAFKGVAVEGGRHAVRLRFDPWRFRAGAWISGLTALMLIALAAAQSSMVPRK